MDCKLIFRNGKPILDTEKGELPFLAYLTYFTENARYGDFSARGYHLYSVCCYFTSLPINPFTGFTPARRGIFDEKGRPDFSEFDAEVAALLAQDPQALFFPRIYISMPAWWVQENPSEIIPTEADPDGRELLYSERFRQDGADMLRRLLKHMRESAYADALIGYQVSGGVTQEWMDFDHGNYHANAYPYFLDYMEKKQKGSTAGMTLDGFLRDEYGSDYSRFVNDAVSDTVEWFSSICKRECDGRQIVGAFYGYTLEVHKWGRCGTFSMSRLLNSKNIDFFCSPFSYSGNRSLDADLSYMIAFDSVRLHGKAYILEADIRTHLSRYPDECRKDIKIKTLYRSAIWLGEKDQLGTIYQLRRAFAKVLTGAGGLWWFDMWGGWYATEASMRELERLRLLACEAFSEPLPSRTRAAVIVDEKLWDRDPKPAENIQLELCKRSYSSGIVSDVYLTEDVEQIKDRYRLFMFPQPSPDAAMLEKLRAEGKTCLYGAEIGVSEIRAACRNIGMDLLSESDDIIYEGNGFLALHALSSGEKTVTLPRGFTASRLLDGEAVCRQNVLHFSIERGDTALFRIKRTEEQ